MRETHETTDPNSSHDPAKAKHSILSTMDVLFNSGLQPFDGEWLPEEEYRKRLRADKRKARVRFFEIIMLNLFFMLLSAILVLIVLFISI